MMIDQPQPSAPGAKPEVSVPGMSDRSFFRALLAIAAAGLIPLVAIGRSQFIGFDGWWHVFIATQDRLLMLAGEWKGTAHPPLFYPILRLTAAISHSPLMLRAIGIVSGTVSSVAIGVVAGRIYRYKSSALLVSAAYTFAWSMIELNCDVRAYPLALVFVLLAFNALIDWTREPGGVQSASSIMRFGAWSLLAMLSEYYVIFFFAGCIGILLLRAVLRPAFRIQLFDSIRRDRIRWLLSIVSVSAVFATSFVFHMIVRPQDQAYLQSFVWHDDPAADPGSFLMTNFRNEVGFFTPFRLDPALMLAVVALLALPALIYLVFVRREARRDLAVYPPLLLAGIVVQLVVLSLADRYPFGGEFRHQSIVAPFAFLTAFLLLDRLAGLTKSSLARNALFLSVGLLVASAFAFGWRDYPWSSAPLVDAEYRHFRALFPDARNIYGDNTSFIFYYSRNHNSKWTFEDRFLARDQRIIVYKVDDGTGHPVRLLHNKPRTWFELTDPETYQTMTDALRSAGVRSVVLYEVGRSWDAASAKVIENKIHVLAAAADLECGRYEVGPNYVFAEFTLVN